MQRRGPRERPIEGVSLASPAFRERAVLITSLAYERGPGMAMGQEQYRFTL